MRRHILLVLIFLAVLGFRLHYAFKEPYFADDRAYFALRQVEAIRETGTPLYEDELSYGGRRHIFLPLYYYLLAAASLVMPAVTALKLVPNLFAAATVFPVFWLAHRSTKNEWIALITAFLAGFVPEYAATTLNSASAYSIIMPVMLTALYCFVASREEHRYANRYLIAFILLVLLHPTSAIFALSLLLYLLLIKLAGLKVTRAELELALFSALFALWGYFILYKRVFLLYGSGFLWLNTPSEMLGGYFEQLTLISAITQVGVVTLAAGIYVAYRELFRSQSAQLYAVISLGLAAVIVLWLRFVPLAYGLTVLGLVTIALFADFLSILLGYLDKTKAAAARWPIVAVAVAFVLLTSGASTIFYTEREAAKSTEPDTVEAMQWLATNTDPDAVVLGLPTEGHLISAIGKRQNVADTAYVLAPDAGQRAQDIDTIYSTSSEVDAVRMLNKYDVNYLLFSVDAKLAHRRTSLPYTEDAHCFALVFDKLTQIYQVRCAIESQ